MFLQSFVSIDWVEIETLHINVYITGDYQYNYQIYITTRKKEVNLKLRVTEKVTGPVFQNNLLGIMNVCAKFYGNTSSACWDISVWTNTVIHRVMLHG